MTSLPVAANGTAAPTPGAPAVSERWSRWSDRINPILVREVQQAVKGRLFAIMVLVTLAITVVVAVVVGSEYRPDGSSGRRAFEYGTAVLVPLVLFVVPMQAYHSMRYELRSGIVEQLLLTRLRPRSILLGKLSAAMVQFLLYVAVVAPLLATSYLLRGVDVPTVVFTLLFAALACAVATMLTVSAAAQSVVPAFQSVAMLGTAFGLGIATFGTMAVVLSGEATEALGRALRSGWFWRATSGFALLAVYVATLSGLMARAFLVHTFENRTTCFRVLLAVTPLLAFGWMAASVTPASRDIAIPVLGSLLLVHGIVCGLFFATEQHELSPRLRAHAPKNPLLAVLAAPFLPGRDRGLLCQSLYLLLLGAVLATIWPRTGRARSGFDEMWPVGTLLLGYGLLWNFFGHLVRGRLGPAVAANNVARVLLPVLFLAACLLPPLVDVFVHGEIGGWHVGYVLNPFATVQHFASPDRQDGGLLAMLVLLGGAVLLQVPFWWRGVREVLAASAARRAAAAGAVAAEPRA
jgi:hypothetical protein